MQPLLVAGHELASYRAVLDALPLAAMLLDEDWTIRLWNPIAAEWTGVSPHDAEGRNLWSCFPDISRDRFQPRMTEIFQAGGFVTFSAATHGSFLGVALPDGAGAMLQETHIQLVGSAPKLALLTIQDVTTRIELHRTLERSRVELRRTIRATADSERRFHNLFDGFPYALLEFDAQGRCLHSNERWRQWTGQHWEELVGSGWQAAIHADDRSIAVEFLASQFSQCSGDTLHLRLLIDKEKTSAVRCEVGRRAFEEDDHASRFVSFVDATDEIRFAQEVQQAQKMQAIGQLAAGVAHDFNNLLTVILGHCEMIDHSEAGSGQRLYHRDEIQKAATRAAAVTRQLLDFSRKRALNAASVDLNAVVLETESLLRRLIGERIELVVAVDHSVCLLQADKSQIEQVLMNLAVNARDAMPTGGILRIETSKSEALVDGRPSGAVVVLTVVDTGVGMEPAVQSRIFEPFFTTKRLGEGTGLGLATVYGIVRQTGGTIEVASEPHQGSEFRIVWPAACVSRAEDDAAPQPSPSSACREVVLLAEDDDDVRMMACRALERHGYSVLTAGCGEEAIGICRDFPGAVHVLITDVVMPGVSGQRLVESARKLRPDLRIIFMSGYSEDVVLKEGLQGGEIEFLAKPLTGAKLASIVRKVLDLPRADR